MNGENAISSYQIEEDLTMTVTLVISSRSVSIREMFKKVSQLSASIMSKTLIVNGKMRFP